MFKWFKRKKNGLKPLEVYVPIVESDYITHRGIFEYQCKIKCNALNGEYYVTVTVDNNITIPQTRCPCGKILNLYSAPIVKERKLGNQLFRSRCGEMTAIHIGDTHVIRLGKTFKYELTA